MCHFERTDCVKTLKMTGNPEASGRPPSNFVRENVNFGGRASLPDYFSHSLGERDLLTVRFTKFNYSTDIRTLNELQWLK